MGGSTLTPSKERTRWARNGRMGSGCMTCMGMFGSGAGTGTAGVLRSVARGRPDRPRGGRRPGDPRRVLVRRPAPLPVGVPHRGTPGFRYSDLGFRVARSLAVGAGGLHTSAIPGPDQSPTVKSTGPPVAVSRGLVDTAESSYSLRPSIRSRPEKFRPTQQTKIRWELPHHPSRLMSVPRGRMDYAGSIISWAEASGIDLACLRRAMPASSPTQRENITGSCPGSRSSGSVPMSQAS